MNISSLTSESVIMSIEDEIISAGVFLQRAKLNAAV